MNETSTTDSGATQILGGTAALRVGLVLLVGLGLSLALAIFDRQRRPTIEAWEEVTAVGDKAFFVPPSDPAMPAIVVSDAGQFTIASGERTRLKDTQMRRVGRDASTGVPIFQLEARQAPAQFFVRTAPGEYLPAVPAVQ